MREAVVQMQRRIDADLGDAMDNLSDFSKSVGSLTKIIDDQVITRKEIILRTKQLFY